MAKAEINGNFHSLSAKQGSAYKLKSIGVIYHGDSKWTLPEGADAHSMGNDDWIITLSTGVELRVWTEE